MALKCEGFTVWQEAAPVSRSHPDRVFVVNYGLWTMVYGLTMDYGLWTMD